MRTSNFYLFPLKENPNDAFLASHKLMLRSNMIRQSAAGIYTWLPLGLIVLMISTNLFSGASKVNLCAYLYFLHSN